MCRTAIPAAISVALALCLAPLCRAQDLTREPPSDAAQQITQPAAPETAPDISQALAPPAAAVDASPAATPIILKGDFVGMTVAQYEKNHPELWDKKHEVFCHLKGTLDNQTCLPFGVFRSNYKGGTLGGVDLRSGAIEFHSDKVVEIYYLIGRPDQQRLLGGLSAKFGTPQDAQCPFGSRKAHTAACAQWNDGTGLMTLVSVDDDLQKLLGKGADIYSVIKVVSVANSPGDKSRAAISAATDF